MITMRMKIIEKVYGKITPSKEKEIETMKYTLYRTVINETTCTITTYPVAGFMDKRTANRAMKTAIATETDSTATYKIEKN